MPNLSALADSIIAGLFALFLCYVAVQPVLATVLLKLHFYLDTSLLTSVSQLLSWFVIPPTIATLTYRNSIVQRR